MLRFLVLLLLLANGAYYAWSQGLLLAWGQGPVQQSEPQRLGQQIRPEAVRILKPDEARRLETAVSGAPRAPECLASGPLDEPQLAALRPLLDAWPAASWSLEPGVEPARWIVYMGRYGGVEQVARKRAELRQLGVSFEALSNATLEPGLSLGGFATQAAANDQLAALAERGVRTARVVQERPEVRGLRLMLPAVDEFLRPRLDELRVVLKDKTLRPCR
jgi:hypothetical protein